MQADLNQVKLCDFGLSRIKTSFQQTTTVSSIQGTPSYMAPEQLKATRLRCNYETDMWASGSTIVEIFMSKDLCAIPFDANSMSYVNNCLNQKIDSPTLMSALQKFPDIMGRMQHMLAVQGHNRPSMKGVHKLFTECLS